MKNLLDAIFSKQSLQQELWHDKTNKMSVRPAKTQISLGIRPVWSESSLSTWRNLGSLATLWARSEDSDQTGRVPRLIWIFAGHTLILLVCHVARSQKVHFLSDLQVPIINNCPTSPKLVTNMQPAGFAEPFAVDLNLKSFTASLPNFHPEQPVYTAMSITYRAQDFAGNTATCRVSILISGKSDSLFASVICIWSLFIFIN